MIELGIDTSRLEQTLSELQSLISPTVLTMQQQHRAL